MTELLPVPWYLCAVPVCAIFAAVTVSKLLNISRMVSFLGAFAPLALPYSELQVQPSSLFSKPYMQVVGGWGAMLTAALVWVLFRTLVKATRGPVGLIRTIFSTLLLASGVVVALLIVNPEALTTYAPSWRESAGGLLLTVSVLGIGIYFVRLFKTAALLGVCVLSAVVLGSQVAFSKMPYELGDEECERIEQALPVGLPKGIVETGVRRVVKASASARDALRSATSHDIKS